LETASVLNNQGWYEFRGQLEHKQAWRGGYVVALSSQNTSRRCSRCGHVDSANRKTQACFECVACGFKRNADLNAACNILAAGHATIACGASSPEVGASSQELSEATTKEITLA
jgi:putative transposase